jgi:endonuclease YncB( thermonuclease family)
MAIVLGARVETTSLAPTAPGGGEVKRTIIGNKGYVKVYIPYLYFSRRCCWPRPMVTIAGLRLKSLPLGTGARMNHQVIAGALCASLLIPLASAPARADVTGKPLVIDGDTLEIAGERIRLYGIAAPAPDQTCTAGGAPWRCGEEATYALAFETAYHWVTCKGEGHDREGRRVAVCYVGPYDLNALMVRKGWALADRRYASDYVDEEDEARAARRGLWRGEFVAPWEWRR